MQESLDVSAQSVNESPTSEVVEPEVAQQVALSAAVGAFVIADWMQQGENYSKSAIGKIEHWALPSMSGTRFYESTKQKLETFSRRWQLLARKGAKSTEDIHQQILSESGEAAEGALVFREMLQQPPNNSKYHLSGHTAHYVKEILESEGQSLLKRSDVLLSAAQQLAHNTNAPHASYLICEALKKDPIIGNKAQQIQDSIPSTRLISESLGYLGSPVAALGLGALRQLPATLASLASAENATIAYTTGVSVGAHVSVDEITDAHTRITNTIPISEQKRIIKNSPDLNELAFNKSDLAEIAKRVLETRYGTEKPRGQEQLQIAASHVLPLRAEISSLTSDSALKPEFYQERIGALRQDVRDIVATQEGYRNQLEGIRERVYKEIGVYNREQILAINALDGTGTNCQGRTTLMLDAVKSSGIELPEGKILGVQSYLDHREPVIYDTTSGTAVGLVDGKIRTKIDNPIHHPDILLYGYAKGRGITPQIDTDEMLIAGNHYGISDETGTNAVTGSNFIPLPPGGTSYYSGEPPAFAIDQYKPTETTPSPWGSDPSIDEAPLSNPARLAGSDYEYFFSENPDMRVNLLYSDRPIFRNERDLNLYGSLNSDGRTAFLRSLTSEQHIKAHAQWEKHYLPMLDVIEKGNPTSIMNSYFVKDDDPWQLMENLKNTRYDRAIAMASGYAGQMRYREEGRYREDLRFPSFIRYEAAMSQLKKDVQANAVGFVKAYDAADSIRQRGFEEAIDIYGDLPHVDREFNEILKPMFMAIQAPVGDSPDLRKADVEGDEVSKVEGLKLPTVSRINTGPFPAGPGLQVRILWVGSKTVQLGDVKPSSVINLYNTLQYMNQSEPVELNSNLTHLESLLSALSSTQRDSFMSRLSLDELFELFIYAADAHRVSPKGLDPNLSAKMKEYLDGIVKVTPMGDSRIK